MPRSNSGRRHCLVLLLLYTIVHQITFDKTLVGTSLVVSFCKLSLAEVDAAVGTGEFYGHVAAAIDGTFHRTGTYPSELLR